MYLVQNSISARSQIVYGKFGSLETYNACYLIQFLIYGKSFRKNFVSVVVYKLFSDQLIDSFTLVLSFNPTKINVCETCNLYSSTVRSATGHKVEYR